MDWRNITTTELHEAGIMYNGATTNEALSLIAGVVLVIICCVVGKNHVD